MHGKSRQRREIDPRPLFADDTEDAADCHRLRSQGFRSLHEDHGCGYPAPFVDPSTKAWPLAVHARQAVEICPGRTQAALESMPLPQCPGPSLILLRSGCGPVAGSRAEPDFRQQPGAGASSVRLLKAVLDERRGVSGSKPSLRSPGPCAASLRSRCGIASD